MGAGAENAAVGELSAQAPQQRLNFLPEPHGQLVLRPTLAAVGATRCGLGTRGVAAARSRATHRIRWNLSRSRSAPCESSSSRQRRWTNEGPWTWGAWRWRTEVLA